MKIDVLNNVKITLDGTTYRFRAGVQDVPQAVGELLVKGGIAEAVKAQAEAKKPDPKPESKPAAKGDK